LAPPQDEEQRGEQEQRPQPPSRHESLPVLQLPQCDFELRLGEVLGRGASGASVLHCTVVAPGGGRPCAAKVLPLSAQTFPDMVEDFGREVKLMQGLHHPGLVGFLGAQHLCAPPPLPDDAEEAYVLCLELCDVALDAVIRQRRLQNRPFESEELGPLLAQVAAGLAYLHERRILHRDMKAANVFLQLPNVESSGNTDASAPSLEDFPVGALCAKLGDFGACKAASRAQTPVHTPQWMAPEVARQEIYGPPSDVWGLGALIFELLELGIPYGEEITFPQLEDELTSGRPPTLSDVTGAELRAPELVALMKACLAPQPADRPSAAEVCRRLAAQGWPGPTAEAPAKTAGLAEEAVTPGAFSPSLDGPGVDITV